MRSDHALLVRPHRRPTGGPQAPIPGTPAATRRPHLGQEACTDAALDVPTTPAAWLRWGHPIGNRSERRPERPGAARGSKCRVPQATPSVRRPARIGCRPASAGWRHPQARRAVCRLGQKARPGKRPRRMAQDGGRHRLTGPQVTSARRPWASWPRRWIPALAGFQGAPSTNGSCRWPSWWRHQGAAWHPPPRRS